VSDPPGRSTRSRALSNRFLVVNPRSGGDRPTPAEVAAEARRLGVETRLLREGEDAADVAAAAVRSGATALGIAAGDGPLGAVAAVAAEHDLPFVCVPFGTRNHFARDLGLVGDDPLAALTAFHGEERRVDLAVVDGRAFLNNVSFGIYAALVHDPGRRTRNRVMAFLRLVSAALGRSRRPLDLSFETGGRQEHVMALIALIANNDYRLTNMAGLAERSRLDEGRLHAYVIRAVTRRKLVGLLALAAVGRLERAAGWEEWAATRFRIDSSRTRLHAAIDGDPVVLEPPLELEIRPGALRVLVPAPD
jgi:diacylglycerol kinase family enzyme